MGDTQVEGDLGIARVSYSPDAGGGRPATLGMQRTTVQLATYEAWEERSGCLRKPGSVSVMPLKGCFRRNGEPACVMISCRRGSNGLDCPLPVRPLNGHFRLFSIRRRRPGRCSRLLRRQPKAQYRRRYSCPRHPRAPCEPSRTRSD